MDSVSAHVHHHGAGLATVGIGDAALAMPFIAAVIVYTCAALGVQRGRGSWPGVRIAAWTAGVSAIWLGTVGPLAAAAHESFVAHMAAHLLVGMVAPLLLVLAAPITLALRSFSIEPARRVSAVLRSPLARVLTHPIVAAVLSLGGLAVLYLTPVFEVVHRNPLLHIVVMVHVLLAGVLFTASVIAVDPNPHRSPFRLRVGVLVVALAVHAVIAKALYANPPAGLPVSDVEAGAQLMFSGGDLVDATLLVLLGLEWFRATGRRDGVGRGLRRATSTPVPSIASGVAAGNAPASAGARS